MATCSPILKGKTSPTGTKKIIVFFLSKRDGKKNYRASCARLTGSHAAV